MKKIFIIISLLFPFLVIAVTPAVTDVTTNDAPGATSVSFTHTVTAGNSNVDVFAFVESASGGQPISGTYNGGTMTCYDWNDVNTVTGTYQSYCYMTATTTGAATMTITKGNTGANWAVAALTIKNVATGNPLDIMAKYQGSAATSTLTSSFSAPASTTQFADDLIIKHLAVYPNRTGYIDGTGEANWVDFNHDTNRYMEISTKVATTTGTYTMSSSWNAVDNIGDQMSMAIKAFVATANIPVENEQIIIFE